MRVSALTDYALRILIEVAREDPRRVSARELSEVHGMPFSFTQQALTALATAGIVDSRRGSAGGTALARPAEEISVAEVVLATDTPILLVARHRPRDLRYSPRFLGLAQYWRDLESDLASLLAQTTIASLVINGDQAPDTVVVGRARGKREPRPSRPASGTGSRGR